MGVTGFRIQTLVIIIVVSTISTLVTGPGPDYVHYYNWLTVARTGQFSGIQSFTDSPNGIPLSQWAHGPGFLMAFGQWAGESWLGPEESIRIVVFLCNILFWGSTFGIMQIAARGRAAYTLLGVALLAFATNAGYYLRSAGSETFALTSAAVLLYTASSTLTRSVSRGILLFCSPLLLIICRVQFAPASLAITTLLLCHNTDISGRKRVRDVAILFTGILAGVIQLLFVNYWMTGSPWQSPYTFSDAEYSSFSIRHSHFAEILLSPANGLLPFHPFAFFGFVSLLFLAGSRVQTRQARLAQCTIIVILVQYCISAMWYSWWLGESFGMRGLSITFLFLVPAFVRWVVDAPPPRAIAMAAFAALCGIGSSLFIFKETKFNVYFSEIVQSAVFALSKPKISIPWVVGSLILILIVRHAKRRGIMQFPDDIVRACAALILGAGGQYVIDFLIRKYQFAGLVAPGVEMGVRVAITITIIMVVWRFGRHTTAFPRTVTKQRVPAVAALIAGMMTLFVIICFARLAWNTQQFIQQFHATSRPGGTGRPVSTFDLAEVRASLEACEAIPGCEADSARLRAFIERENLRRAAITNK